MIEPDNPNTPDNLENPESEKKQDEITIKTEDFKDRVRFPLVMHVVDMEFEPDVPLAVITRTAYDLLLTEDDVLKLYMFLAGRIKHRLFKDTRIRFIGRVTEE